MTFLNNGLLHNLSEISVATLRAKGLSKKVILLLDNTPVHYNEIYYYSTMANDLQNIYPQV